MQKVTHKKPSHLHRASVNQWTPRQKMKFAQAASLRQKDPVEVTLPIPPWTKQKKVKNHA